ncbi:MAG TPA: bifunctional riboflavin kinase/FAD synthetase [Actinomycetota bacterium]|nr:bifunctional riboflavin kinase/FAD synthetase [Actinomycetota bacterium]
MRRVLGIENLSPPPNGCAVAIGTFDGVHLGHRALIDAAKRRAEREGLASAILTWDRHPNETVHPDRIPPLLTSTERRIELLSEQGADLLAVLEFNRELSSWSPERFVKEVLANGLSTRVVTIGEGWRFGRGAAGTVELLEELGSDLGFEVEVVPLQVVDGEPVSSSRVRSIVASGDMQGAEKLLQRPFDVEGVVVHGDDRGAGLGFPTANVALHPLLASPARGVYAGRARADEKWHTAAINVGVNPTFGGDPSSMPMRIEAFLLDFSGGLYDETIRIEFHERLRDEERFPSADALVEQMKLDVEATRRVIESRRDSC